jgi:hypothetical protein
MGGVCSCVFVCVCVCVCGGGGVPHAQGNYENIARFTHSESTQDLHSLQYTPNTPGTHAPRGRTCQVRWSPAARCRRAYQPARICSAQCTGTGSKLGTHSGSRAKTGGDTRAMNASAVLVGNRHGIGGTLRRRCWHSRSVSIWPGGKGGATNGWQQAAANTKRRGNSSITADRARTASGGTRTPGPPFRLTQPH